jgi:hypothetical protein
MSKTKSRKAGKQHDTIFEKYNPPAATPLWDDNLIQFSRFISEAEVAGAFPDRVMAEMEENMDLSPEELSELIDRAQTAWEEQKRRI